MTSYPKRLRRRKRTNPGVADLFSFAVEHEALAIEAVRHIVRKHRVTPSYARLVAESLGMGGRG